MYIPGIRHTLFTNYLSTFRADNENVRVDALPFEDGGLGLGWQWENEARQIQISSDREKWDAKTNKIGYQLNIALKPAEIAAENAVTPAILLLSKGLSNSIAIPTLSLVAETRKPWTRGDLHSHVKDLHAIWVKDSVPNITLAAVQGSANAQARRDLASVIDEVRKTSDLIPRDILTKVPNYEPQGVNATAENTNLLTRIDPPADGEGQGRLEVAAQAEASACLDQVRSRLNEIQSTPKKISFG